MFTMNHKVILLEDDNYDLLDQPAPEYDFSAAKLDHERSARFRAEAVRRLILLDQDVAARFPDAQSVNEALRRIIAEEQQAGSAFAPAK